MPTNAPEPVSFITVGNEWDDDEDDLMLSFAIDLGEPGEVASVILQRDPEFEPLLPEEDHGVSVSHELHPDTDDEFLLRLRMTRDRVEIESTVRDYALDISRIDPEELREAREMLRRMNFDGNFELDLGEPDPGPG